MNVPSDTKIVFIFGHSKKNIHLIFLHRGKQVRRDRIALNVRTEFEYC